MPETTIIGREAFRGCKKITTVDIPNSITSIGSSAFAGCYNLKYLVIPENVTSIGQWAFATGILLYEPQFILFRFYNDNDIFDKCSALLICPKKVGKKYKSCYSNINTVDIVAQSSTQTSLTLSSTSYFSITEADFHYPENYQISVADDSFTETAVNGKVTASGLLPEYEYSATVTGIAFGQIPVSGDIGSVETQSLGLDISQQSRTNTTLKLKGSYLTGDASVASLDFGQYGTGQNITIQNLTPGQKVKVILNATLNNGAKYSVSEEFSTQDIRLSANVSDLTSTSAKLRGSYSGVVDATVTNHCWGDGYPDIADMYGLEPNTSYRDFYYVTTQEGGTISKDVTFRTPALQFTTEPAQTVSNTKAVITATTNGEDDALRFGFEWRRYDAPDLVPSSVAYCPLYNGEISGTLNGLSPNTYYKYRPVYKSNSGRMYYGDWSAFGTADAYVYFTPTVHTLPPLSVSSNGATLRGHVTDGSDNTVEQGFEYWMSPAESSYLAAPADIHTVTSTGMLMNAAIGDLRPDTEYHFRSFATTAKETTYGEELTFQTAPGVGGVEYIDADIDAPEVIGYYNLQGVKADEPWPGLNIAVYSDGTTRKILNR